jgi:hypothetical protein
MKTQNLIDLLSPSWTCSHVVSYLISFTIPLFTCRTHIWYHSLRQLLYSAENVRAHTPHHTCTCTRLCVIYSPCMPHLTCLTLLTSQLRKPIGHPAGYHGLHSASRLQGRGLPKHVGRVRMGEQGQALLTLPLHLHLHPLLCQKCCHPVLYYCIHYTWHICFSSPLCLSLLSSSPLLSKH